MKLSQLKNKGVVLVPETASDHYFLDYLTKMILAREREILNELAESFARDFQPSGE